MNIPLLLQLRAARDRFVPLHELGSDSHRVGRDLDELQEFGYGIECHPLLGAVYRGPAERLCPDQIEHELDTRYIGQRIAVWNRTSSTNDLAARAAGSIANDGLVILAEEQTAGRGRRGRFWTAPPRSCLLLSVLLFPPDSLAESPWLTALGAVAAAEVVAAWTGLYAQIKWPNDVRVGGRKIAGVLVERSAGAVIGIGLNANVGTHDLGAELEDSATSLQILSGRQVDRSELARCLITRLDHWYELGQKAGAESLSARWKALSEHLGQFVLVQTHATEAAGHVEDMDFTSGITLSVPGSTAVRFCLADVLSITSIAAESAVRTGP